MFPILQPNGNNLLLIPYCVVPVQSLLSFQEDSPRVFLGPCGFHMTYLHLSRGCSNCKRHSLWSRPVMASFWVTNIHFHISDLYVDIIKVNDIRFLLLLRVLLPEVNAKGLRRWLSQTTRLILSNHCWIAQNHLLSTVLNCRESFQYIRGNIKILKGKDSFTRIDFKSTTASRTLMPQRLGHIILRTK